jgi:hypothetical protein
VIGNVIGVLFDGLAYGSLLFIIAVGLSVTLGLMNFVNLAHGAFAMAGGYITVILVNRLGLPFLASLPLAFVFTAIVGLVFERTPAGAEIGRDDRVVAGLPQQLLQPHSRGPVVFHDQDLRWHVSPAAAREAPRRRISARLSPSEPPPAMENHPARNRLL